MNHQIAYYLLTHWSPFRQSRSEGLTCFLSGKKRIQRKSWFLYLRLKCHLSPVINYRLERFPAEMSSSLYYRFSKDAESATIKSESSAAVQQAQTHSRGWLASATSTDSTAVSSTIFIVNVMCKYFVEWHKKKEQRAEYVCLHTSQFADQKKRKCWMKMISNHARFQWTEQSH